MIVKRITLKDFNALRSDLSEQIENIKKATTTSNVQIGKLINETKGIFSTIRLAHSSFTTEGGLSLYVIRKLKEDVDALEGKFKDFRQLHFRVLGDIFAMVDKFSFPDNSFF